MQVFILSGLHNLICIGYKLMYVEFAKLVQTMNFLNNYYPSGWWLFSNLFYLFKTVNQEFVKLLCRVSDPMLNPVPKSGHFLHYLNFGALFGFFLWSICWNLCNLALVICLLIYSRPNLNKSKFFYWSNYGTKGVEHWVTYPTMSHTLQSALEARIMQIDLSAAFDGVNNQGILYKLCSVSIGGSVLSILGYLGWFWSS